MDKIVVIGGGDYSKKVIRLVQRERLFKIIGYTDLNDKGDLFGVNYLGNDDIIEELKKKNHSFKVILGIAGNLAQVKRRGLILKYLSEINVMVATVISSMSYIDNTAIIGNGVVIFDNAYIDFEVELGNNSVVNINSTICHNAIIKENVIISPSSTIAGGAKIGCNSFLGINVTVNPYIEINEY